MATWKIEVNTHTYWRIIAGLRLLAKAHRDDIQEGVSEGESFAQDAEDIANMLHAQSFNTKGIK